MPHKGKLPPEKKVRIVQEYLTGHLGTREFARKYAIRKNRLYEWGVYIKREERRA